MICPHRQYTCNIHPQAFQRYSWTKNINGNIHCVLQSRHIFQDMNINETRRHDAELFDKLLVPSKERPVLYILPFFESLFVCLFLGQKITIEFIFIGPTFYLLLHSCNHHPHFFFPPYSQSVIMIYRRFHFIFSSKTLKSKYHSSTLSYFIGRHCILRSWSVKCI